jgi:hypothetical protein
MPIDFAEYKPIQTRLGNMPRNLDGATPVNPDIFKQQRSTPFGAGNSARVNSALPLVQDVAPTEIVKQPATPPTVKPAIPISSPSPTPSPRIPASASTAGPMVLAALLTKPVGDLGEAFGKNALLPLVNKIDEKLGLRPDPEYAKVRDRVERRYEEALRESQQKLARQLDNSRINNAPQLTGSQTVTITVKTFTTAPESPAGVEASNAVFTNVVIPLGATFSVERYADTSSFTGASSAVRLSDGRYYQGGNTFTATRASWSQRITTVSMVINTTNQNPVTSSPQPPYPNPDTWLYGSPTVQVGGSALELSKKLWEDNGLKPFKEAEPLKPLNISLSPDNTDNPVTSSPRPDTGLNRTPSGSPTVREPKEEKRKDLGLIPSMSKPPFVAKPFVSGVSNPSELYDPVDVKTGLTRSELEQQWINQQNQIQENGRAKERDSALADATVVKQQLDSLSDTPDASLGGKSPKQHQTAAYLNSIKGIEVRESAFKQVVGNTLPLNSTPTTPASNPNTAQILGGIAAVAGTVTALKIGSDLLVNNSLSNTPKIDQIAQNTTNTNQQTNAKQGVCDAMQPQQCGYEGVKQATTEATNPIKEVANANNGLLSALNTLLSGFIAFAQGAFGKILNILNNTVIDRTLAVMNLATNIHNAAMLTRDIGETLGSVVDNVISLTPLRFTNSEGSQVQFTDFVGSNFRAFLVSVLGAENYVSLVLQWQKANTIYHSAMGVLNTTQSMIDPISSAVEYGMENVSKIGNSLKEDGVVSENAYPAMDETIRARRVNRFERLNDTLEGAENIASNLSSVTSSAVSVKEDWKQLREDSKDLKDKASAFNTADSEARAALKAELPTEITPITLAPAPAEDEEP